MKSARIVVLLVIGLMGGYSLGIERVTAQSCPSGISCPNPFTCQAYEYYCFDTCYPPFGGYCQTWVGRCFWDDGPICSNVNCLPEAYCM